MSSPPASTDARPRHRPPRVILASRSPRRRLLLARAGIEHDTVDPGIDDADLLPGAVPPEQWAAALAYLKARAGAARHAAAGCWVLGADTVCVKDGRLFGQPLGASDARRILRTLESGEHEVITGVALVRAQRRELWAERARVRVGRIGDERLESYVASGAWAGKAGAYNLSERLEAGWPIEYDGDPGTIMGLPTGRLLRALDEPGRGDGA